MADQAAQLQALKDAASAHEAQIHAAATHKDALEQAIAAAENLIDAMKLTVDPNEKKLLKKRFDVIEGVAKSMQNNTWAPSKPSARMSSGNSTEASSGQIDNPDAAGMKPLQHNSSGTRATFKLFESSESTSSRVYVTPSFPAETNEDSMRSDQSPNTSQSQMDPVAQNDLNARFARVALKETPVQPKTSVTHVRTLREPVSLRKRTMREDIILLKASFVSGIKCPPWDKIPSSDEFSLHPNGVFTQPNNLSLSPQQQEYFVAWVRAQDAVPRRAAGAVDKPVMSSSRPIDLVQDAATDCSVVASLCAAIARSERGHEKILSTKLYPYDRNSGKPVISSNGKYIVRLNFNGCWRKVKIDDRLPTSDKRALHVVDRRQPALLWPALLEKAYLTIRGGYDFPGSNSCSDLWALTGWIPEQIHLQETDIVPDQLWRRLYKAFTFGDVLATLGTGPMTSRQERELGLEGQHSYVVLDLKETESGRLLLVKNPWVEGRGWFGPRPSTEELETLSTVSDSSKDGLATYHRATFPTPDQRYPTTFWIGLEQVIRHFESLYLNWNPGLFRYRQDIHFEWTVGGSSGEENRCLVSHPQFLFRSQEASQVWFLLSRHFRETYVDGKEGSDAFNDGSIQSNSLVNASNDVPKGYMSIFVCSGEGNRLYIKDTCLERSDYMTTPQCLLRWDTVANSASTVVIDQDELPASTYSFTLSAFCNSKIDLEPAIPKYPISKTVIGEWTQQTAGGGTGSGEYFRNPQYSLELKNRGRVAILLTSNDGKNALHAKLTLGYGKRMYRLNSRDVLADTGDHRARCVFTESKDLEPGLYTIVCSLFEAGQTGEYTLRVDSTEEVKLDLISRDGAGLLLNRLSPVCFRPVVNEVVAPLYPRRLASYTIVVRFLRATTPRASGELPTSRSPVRFSVEYGTGPERRFVITSEHGQYSDAAIIRTEAVDIDPHFYPAAGAGMYLVLDRLSGPGGPVEEWYDVDLYTDVPQAYNIGVWRDRVN